MTTRKVNNKRIVPTRRFNLEAGAPSKVLSTLKPSVTQEITEGMTMVAHPVLRSVPLPESADSDEELPIMDDDQEGPLYRDRHDDDVRWYLPEYDLVKAADLEEPLLMVQDIGVDEEGERVFSGKLTLPFAKKKSERVGRALEEARRENPDIKSREIPLAPKEVELRLTYLKDGEQEQTDTYKAKFDSDKNQAQLELRSGALQLAYSLVAEGDGAAVRLIGDFNSWVPVEERAEAEAAEEAEAIEQQMQEMVEQEAEAIEQQAQMEMAEAAAVEGAARETAAAEAKEEQLTAKPVLAKPAITSSFKKEVALPQGGIAPAVNINTGVKVRFEDKGKGASKGGAGSPPRKKKRKVRDHRDKRTVKVRDHRDNGKVKVRDHREEDGKDGRKDKKVKVRDHRKDQQKGDIDFRFRVVDVFEIKGRGTVALGNLKDGSVQVGDPVLLIPSSSDRTKATAVTGISKNKKAVDSLQAPEKRIGLILRGVDPNEIAQGDRLVNTRADVDRSEPDRPYAKQRQIIRQERQLKVPCSQFRKNYQFVEQDEETQIFGCNPPWGGGFKPGARYRELGRSHLDLPDELWRQVSIYESLNEVAVFLLVPKSYVIGRTTDTYSPALSMTTVLDPENTMESKVVFDFVVTPSLLPFTLWQLKEALAGYLREQVGIEREPDLRFPTSLETPPELEWNGPFTKVTQFIVDGDAYVLTAEANSVGEAHAVVQRIKESKQSLSGNFICKLDESIESSSAIIVDLNRTTAPALEVKLADDAGSAKLTNRCESLVKVNRLLFHRADPPQIRIQSLPEVQNLPPEAQFSMLVPEESYDGVEADYEIEEDTSLSLSELRVDVSMLEVGIGVDTDLQPQERFQIGSNGKVGLESVRVALDVSGAGQDSLSLLAEDDHFQTDVVSLLVPLDRYLEPESRTLRYQATFTFADDTEMTTNWLDHNYGRNPNLTIRRQELERLLAE